MKGWGPWETLSACPAPPAAARNAEYTVQTVKCTVKNAKFTSANPILHSGPASRVPATEADSNNFRQTYEGIIQPGTAFSAAANRV